jgi:hypothetical protein
MTTFEDRLAAGLDELAATVEVRVDGAGVPPAVDGGAGGGRRTRPRGRVAFAAAIAAVALAFLGWNGRWGTGARPFSGDAAGESESVALAPEALVWLDPAATAAEIDAVGAWLRSRQGVVELAFFDQQATYAEFLRYYADQPEVRTLVAPEQLPTSYRLAVEGDPAEWVDRVGPVPPAVIAVAEPVPWWQGSFAPAGGDD